MDTVKSYITTFRLKLINNIIVDTALKMHHLTYNS